MNPELERRLADLADAATRATTGIDPVAALAAFRRRRRARVTASTVTAVAALVGLAFGVAQLPPPADAGPAVTPIPGPDAIAEVGACGLPLNEGLLKITGIDRTTPVPEDGPTDGLVVVLHDTVMAGDSVLTISARAEFQPGPFTDKAGPSDVSYTLRPFVLDAQGRVIAYAPPWETLESAPGAERKARFVSCPGQDELASRGGDELELRVAAERSGPTVDKSLALSPALPFEVAWGSLLTAPDDPLLACGLPPAEGFAAITGVPVDAHGTPGDHDMELSLEVDASAVETSRVLSTTSTAAFPGVDPPAGAEPPYTFRIWLLVTGPDGTVVGFTEPWEQPDKEQVDGRSTALERCPDASWSGIREPELFHVHAATAPVGENPPRHLSLADTLPLFRPDPVQLDGPGSCGRGFFLDGVTESVGAMAGLWTDVDAATVSRDGTVAAWITVRNSSDAPLTGTLTLTQLLVEGQDRIYLGSVLTPPEPVVLAEDATIPAGGSLDFDLELAMDPCAEGVLPLEPGRYTVSTLVKLVNADSLGFSSPALEITVD